MTTAARPWLSGGSLLIAVLTITVSTGLRGVFVGSLVVACWWVLPALYTFAFSQFGLVLLLPATSSPAVVASVELRELGCCVPRPLVRRTRSPSSYSASVSSGVLWVSAWSRPSMWARFGP